MNIVLLGAPGSGKGTLARQLKEKYSYFLLSPGDIYRREALNETEFGLKAKAYWADGNLCPDEMTNELVVKTIKQASECNIAFDGYPRNMKQAEYLDEICKINLIFDLTVSDAVAVERLLRRKTIEDRPDDTQEVISQRIAVYHLNNEPIVDYYKRKYKGEFRYFSLGAEGTIEETFGTAEAILLRA